MKRIVALLCVCAFALSLQGPDAPLWPETFSQDYVVGDSKAKLYTSGKLWYDIKNNRQRVDNLNSFFEPICMELGEDRNAACSQLNVDGALYVNLPDKSKCCKCCTAAQGCIIQPRNWLKDFKYAGQATLSGETFYKWSFTSQGFTQSYYATEDEKRVPRRIESGTFGIDFIMNTYSTDPIDNNTFRLPSYCTSQCPGNSCARMREGFANFSGLRLSLK